MWNYSFYVYILTNESKRVLYTGVTSDLVKKVSDHKEKKAKGFSTKFEVDQLIYFEWFANKEDAIAKEKQIRSESRENKLELVNSANKNWKDLSNELWSDKRVLRASA